MAKINARGAHKLFDVEVTHRAFDNITRFTLCSDGRVLRQVRDSDGKLTPFALWAKIGKEENRTREFLLSALARAGYQVQ